METLYKIPGYSPERLYDHAEQAEEAGFIEARFVKGTTDFHALRLTWAGHAFRYQVRSEASVWEKTRALVLKNTGSLSLEAVKIALPMIIRHQFGA